MSSARSTITHVVHGAVAGMIGGAVAAWVMNEYSAAEQRRTQRFEQGRQRAPQQAQMARRAQPTQQQQSVGGEEDATMKTAQLISRRLFHHELTAEERKIAGPIVHYGYGTLAGGLYGALAELWSLPSAGFGLLYGMLLWLVGDEIAVPALRLGPPPTKVPARAHADYLGAHLAYGIALDIARRVARHIV
jgi:uncharacterized membrane protein YagU involved in acid resistance